MVQRIIWAKKARFDLRQIYFYWADRTGSYRYSEKLRDAFKKATQQIAVNISIGRATSNPSVRYYIVGHYKIFYLAEYDTLIILAVFDTRRTPNKNPIE